MSPPSAHKLRSILSQSGWQKAAEILQKLDPEVAADALLDVPFDEQHERVGNARRLGQGVRRFGVGHQIYLGLSLVQWPGGNRNPLPPTPRRGAAPVGPLAPSVGP